MKDFKAVWVLGAVLALGLVACSSDDPADLPDAPVAGFQADPASGDVPLAVSFSDDSTGEPTVWSWDFGDGGTSTERNPDHTYTAAGDFTVALTASNDGGSDTLTDVDCIAVAPVAGGDPPVADFTVSTDAGAAPLAVTFTDASTSGPTVWNWSFGDGGTSTAPSPSHTYTAAGTYTVALTVRNAHGSDTETRTDLITVTDPVGTTPGSTAGHLVTAAFADLPAAWADAAAANLRIFYGHTSHGSQLMSGLDMLEDEDPSLDQPSVHEVDADLGQYGETEWIGITRNHLNTPGNDTNMVIWSWCDGVRYSNDEDIEAYLAAMTQLESDYPDVVFVYMTGHLMEADRDPEGRVKLHNDMIRAYCAANEKWLYDFADIELYDPDGNHYPNDTDFCNWCYDWCATHDCPDQSGCAHSHWFNCYRKGQAFWWLLGRIAGWEG